MPWHDTFSRTSYDGDILSLIHQVSTPAKNWSGVEVLFLYTSSTCQRTCSAQVRRTNEMWYLWVTPDELYSTVSRRNCYFRKWKMLLFPAKAIWLTRLLILFSLTSLSLGWKLPNKLSFCCSNWINFAFNSLRAGTVKVHHIVKADQLSRQSWSKTLTQIQLRKHREPKRTRLPELAPPLKG